MLKWCWNVLHMMTRTHLSHSNQNSTKYEYLSGIILQNIAERSPAANALGGWDHRPEFNSGQSHPTLPTTLKGWFQAQHLVPGWPQFKVIPWMPNTQKNTTLLANRTRDDATRNAYHVAAVTNDAPHHPRSPPPVQFNHVQALDLHKHAMYGLFTYIWLIFYGKCR